MKPQKTQYALLRTMLGTTATRVMKLNVCPACRLSFTDAEKAKHVCNGTKPAGEWSKRETRTDLLPMVDSMPFAWAEDASHPGQLKTAQVLLADLLDDAEEAIRHAPSLAANVLAGASHTGFVITGADLLKALGKTAHDFRPAFKWNYTTAKHGDGHVFAHNEVDAREAIANRLNVERLPKGTTITKEIPS